MSSRWPSTPSSRRGTGGERSQTPGGPIRAVLPPITLDGETARMDPIPALGEHTDAILREFGYSAAVIAELRDDGVVGGGLSAPIRPVA